MALLLAVVYYFICTPRRLPTNSRNLITSACYPPAWLATAPGLFLVLLIAAFSEAAATHLDLAWRNGVIDFPFREAKLAALCFLLLAPLLFLRRRLALRNLGKAPRPSSRSRLLQEDGAFEMWLASDIEVSTPNEALFGHARVAQRIADRILRAIREGAPAPTQAIVGHRGSGKSTIIRLVKGALRQDGSSERVVQVAISLWPYESPEAAVRGILDAIVSAIGMHVNTLPISGLPSEYAELLESSPGFMHNISRHFRPHRKPHDILTRIDAIATAIGMRIVVCVEDLERFAHDDSAPDSEAHTRLSTVRSTLHMLDAQPSISVILASDSLEQRFDIEKIARHVERPPIPAPEEVWAIIRKCKSSCLHFASGMVDPSGKSSPFDSLEAPEDFGSLSAWLASFQPSKPTTQLALAHLLENPRTLKAALRSAADLWQTLAGEIDRDDLLVTSALSARHPELIAFLDAHIDFMRENYGRNTSSTQLPGDAEAKRTTEEQLSSIISRCAHGDTRHKAAIRSLVDFLFLPSAISPSSRPQRVLGGEHTDYWKRLMRGTMAEDETPDQRVLASILKWQTGRTGDLCELMMTSEHCDAVENFESMFSAEEIIDLAQGIIDALKGRTTSEWQQSRSGGKHPAAIVALTRMTKRRPSSEQLIRLVHGVLPDLIRDHLPLANEVLYWFVEGDGSRSLVGDREVKKIRKLTETSLKESFGPGNAEQLRTSLRGGHAYTMLHATYGIDRIRSNELLEAVPPFDRWHPVGSTLIALSESHPDVGFPQLLPFVTDGREGGGHVFREDRARALFDIDRLRGVIRANPRLAFATDSDMSRWQAARSASET